MISSNLSKITWLEGSICMQNIGHCLMWRCAPIDQNSGSSFSLLAREPERFSAHTELRG